jgi:hypothetical protein
MFAASIEVEALGSLSCQFAISNTQWNLRTQIGRKTNGYLRRNVLLLADVPVSFGVFVPEEEGATQEFKTRLQRCLLDEGKVVTLHRNPRVFAERAATVNVFSLVG